MNRKLLVGMMASLMMVGCASQNVKDDKAAAAKPDTSAQPRGAGTGKVAVDPFSDPSNPLSRSVIYFDYDSSTVLEPEVANAHGRYVGTNPTARVRLEGHADERGSREYNVALGEARAKSVRQLMLLQGAKAEQLEIVSYGEERPADPGHDEAAWAKNRRVEIIYEAK